MVPSKSRQPVGGYREAVLSLAPAAYWRLGESGGSEAGAEIGPDLSYRNSPSPGAAGGINRSRNLSINFDASNSESANDRPNVIDAFPFSLVAWFRTTDGTTKQASLALGSDVSDNYWVGLTAMMDQTGTPFEARLSYFGGWSTEVGEVTVGQWHMGAGVFTASEIRAYLDNLAPTTESHSRDLFDGSGNLNQMSIGFVKRQSSSHRWFTGDVDECAVFPRALTDAEIAWLYAVGTGGRSQRVAT